MTPWVIPASSISWNRSSIERSLTEGGGAISNPEEGMDSSMGSAKTCSERKLL
jgi:hypothetical protein